MMLKNSSFSPFIGIWSRVVCPNVNPRISVLLILEEFLGTKDFFCMEELLGRWSGINGSSLFKLFLWYMHFILWLAIRGKLLSPQWFYLCNVPWCCRIPYFNYLRLLSCIEFVWSLAALHWQTNHTLQFFRSSAYKPVLYNHLEGKKLPQEFQKGK